MSGSQPIAPVSSYCSSHWSADPSYWRPNIPHPSTATSRCAGSVSRPAKCCPRFASITGRWARQKRDAQGVVRNAVLILHGTGGEGGSLVRKGGAGDLFAAEMFGAGQPLDATRYFIILPDNIGHGRSSKPSDGLHAKFPRYGYRDLVLAQHRLLTEGLNVSHLRLVMGQSMGGMHTWVWGEAYPDIMDALMPLASLPGPISGRNRMWRKAVIDAIRTDPEWKDGEYTSQPPCLRFAAQLLFLMGSSPLQRQKAAPTLKKADEVFEKGVSDSLARLDANDLLYAVESSFDYDPSPDLERILAPLLAINSADDLINPPEWNPGATNCAGEERTGNCHSGQFGNDRPRHAYQGSGVETASCRAAETDRAVSRSKFVQERSLALEQGDTLPSKLFGGPRSSGLPDNIFLAAHHHGPVEADRSGLDAEVNGSFQERVDLGGAEYALVGTQARRGQSPPVGPSRPRPRCGHPPATAWRL